MGLIKPNKKVREVSDSTLSEYRSAIDRVHNEWVGLCIYAERFFFIARMDNRFRERNRQIMLTRYESYMQSLRSLESQINPVFFGGVSDILTQLVKSSKNFTFTLGSRRLFDALVTNNKNNWMALRNGVR